MAFYRCGSSGGSQLIYAGAMGRASGNCDIQGYTENRAGCYCTLDTLEMYCRVGGNAGTKTYEGTYFTFTTYSKYNSTTATVTATVKIAGKYSANGTEVTYAVGDKITNQNVTWFYLG